MSARSCRIPLRASRYGTSVPIGRAAAPEEIAEVVLFLASNRTSFIVGSVVMVDGGMSVKAGS
ncbi:MAG: SDR family oxidoreductase [Janthinobacterium lividum]